MRMSLSSALVLLLSFGCGTDPSFVTEAMASKDLESKDTNETDDATAQHGNGEPFEAKANGNGIAAEGQSGDGGDETENGADQNSPFPTSVEIVQVEPDAGDSETDVPSGNNESSEDEAAAVATGPGSGERAACIDSFRKKLTTDSDGGKMMIIVATGNADIDVSEADLAAVQAVCIHATGNASISLNLASNLDELSYYGRGNGHTTMDIKQGGKLASYRADISGNGSLQLSGVGEACATAGQTVRGNGQLICE